MTTENNTLIDFYINFFQLKNQKHLILKNLTGNNPEYHLVHNEHINPKLERDLDYTKIITEYVISNQSSNFLAFSIDLENEKFIPNVLNFFTKENFNIFFNIKINNNYLKQLTSFKSPQEEYTHKTKKDIVNLLCFCFKLSLSKSKKVLNPSVLNNTLNLILTNKNSTLKEHDCEFYLPDFLLKQFLNNNLEKQTFIDFTLKVFSKHKIKDYISQLSIIEHSDVIEKLLNGLNTNNSTTLFTHEPKTQLYKITVNNISIYSLQNIKKNLESKYYNYFHKFSLEAFAKFFNKNISKELQAHISVTSQTNNTILNIETTQENFDTKKIEKHIFVFLDYYLLTLNVIKAMHPTEHSIPHIISLTNKEITKNYNTIKSSILINEKIDDYEISKPNKKNKI